MRHLLAVALVAVGCGTAPPTPVVHPASVALTPEAAAAAARAVIDAHYGVEPTAGNARTIVGKAEFLDDQMWIMNRWERGWHITPSAPSSWFRVVAFVENPAPGQVAVRVIGYAANGDQRFDGLEQYIQSGDPRMPRWADYQVAVLQAQINRTLRLMH
jgi:hypothetical protein